MRNGQPKYKEFITDFDRLPIKSKLNIYYTSCKCSEDFSDKFIQLLKGILKPTRKEEIMLSIYMCFHLWLKAAITLNNTMYFQTLASIARSIFEHLLDLKLIADNKIENGIKKFETFGEIDKFRMAKNFADFVKNHPDIKTNGSQKKMEIASNKEIEEKIKVLKSLWNDPKEIKSRHWSGLKIDKRAERAGIQYEEFYYESFVLLSWYIHSGLVGIRKMNKEGLEIVHINSLRLIHEMFIDAILLTAMELKLNVALIGFHDLIQKLKLIPGFAFQEEQNKYFAELEKDKTASNI